MAILNVTPDSFSDSGRFFSPQAALDQALRLLDEGAEILDLGGESTRPNAAPLTAEEEIARVGPTVEAILKARPEAILSIDTYHAATAQRAGEAGAEIVNDVSGHLWDPAMAATCAKLRCGVVLMHTRGRPAEWGELPPIPPLGVMPIVLTGLRDSLLNARTAGTSADCIVLDPGFGFGKRGQENFTLLAQLHLLHQFGLPVLCGVSRKRFLAKATADRGAATQAAHIAAILAGAHILRVHDVAEARRAAAVADAILAAAQEVADKTGSSYASSATTTLQ